MNLVPALNIMADSWVWQAAHAAWQAALVGCVAVLFVRLATRVPAQLRYAILLVALAKFAVPPLLSLPTGMFGFVAIAESQVQSRTPMNESSGNINSEIAMGTSRLTIDSRERIDGQATEAQHDTNAPAAPFESIGSSPILSARELLAGAMQTPVSESTNVFVPAKSSSFAQGLTPWVVSKYQSILDALFTISVFAWLAIVHAAGMFVCAVLLAVRLRSLYRRKQTMSHPETRLGIIYREAAEALGVRRLPELLISPEKTGPYSFGVLRPTIVIPTTCTEHLDSEAVRIVLAHELVHHRRGDLVVNAIQIAIAIVWWFHPVVWILNKSIRRVREDCCDDCLLEAGVTQASDYCQTLLDVANLCDCRRPRTGIAVGMTTDKVPLAARFCRIMDERIARRSKLGWLGGLVLILVALVVLPGISQTSTAVALAPQDQENAATAVTSTAQFTVVDERERTPLPLATDFYVLDNEGQPLVGAPVEVRLSYPNRKKNVSNVLSDDRGVVRFQWPQQRPSWIAVTVKSPDYVFQTKQWNQRPIQCKVPPPQYEFKLIQGVTIGGVVNDGTNGIEGVTVSAAISSSSASVDYVATTAVGGRWEIQNAPSE
ncbi:MAG: M56 family metallopeptidase, partial [Planctomycetales bacterium]|nr:M56 family metallopeptidase [Planctomycetales bacterium]